MNLKKISQYTALAASLPIGFAWKGYDFGSREKTPNGHKGHFWGFIGFIAGFGAQYLGMMGAHAIRTTVVDRYESQSSNY